MDRDPGGDSAGGAALLVGRDDRPALTLYAGTVEEVLTLAAASPDLPAAPDHALHDDLDLLFTAPLPWTPPD